MGLFSEVFGEIFGSSSGGKKDDVSRGYASTRNSAERLASAEHMSEALSTGKDPIPTEPPDWASDIPSPK